MDSPPRVNINPAPTPAIIVTQDDTDEDDEERSEQPPRPNIPHSGPGDGHLETRINFKGLCQDPSKPTSISDASTLIPSPSMSFASQATLGTDRLTSPRPSFSSWSSFEVEAPFEVSPEDLAALMEERDLVKLDDLGGIDGLANRLVSNCTRGLICDDDFAQFAPSRPDALRRAVFGSNKMPDRKAKTVWTCAREAFQDRFLLLLLGLSGFIIVMGLVQPGGGNWADGIPGVLAVLIVTGVGLATSWTLDRKYSRMLKMTEDRHVKVIRGGALALISVHDLMVGDIITSEQGDLVPADGLLISGRNIKCDESCDTGESELVSKSGAPRQGESYIQYLRPDRTPYDPFMISGSRVMEGGDGRCLVTGVGVNSIHGRLMQDVRTTGKEEETPLQQRVGTLTDYITRGAISVAIFVAFALLLRGVGDFKQVLKIFELAVTIILVSVPEGLPMSVLTALISGWHGMHRDRNLVRKLSSCETMGNATTICCDKTGTLTMNEMNVTVGLIGTTGQFAEDHSQSTTYPGPISYLLSDICPYVRDLFVESIAINSTALEGEQNGIKTYIGSGTETALLRVVQSQFGLEYVRNVRNEAHVVEVFPFDSRRKCMATVTKLSENLYRMYVKGAPEILLAKCDRTITDPTMPTESPMTHRTRRLFLDVVHKYGSRSLRTLGFAYRDFETWPLSAGSGEPGILDEAKLFEHAFRNLVFLGVVGIQDPLRPGVRDAVKQCKRAGITVRLVTGDNVTTAQSVAASCGILDDSDYFLANSVWEGPEFRALSSDQMKIVLPTLRVLARSTPEDKKLIVSKLKELGETVAVTGDGTNDGPALRAADVGFAMGISGTEVAKEASSIVLLDDNFASIVKAIAWGRSVYDAIRRFLQFQLTANISVLTYTAFSAIHSGLENPTFFTTAQLLWINLIMDILGAVGLSTDGPDKNILNRRPERRSAGLLSVANWKMIIGQAIYQLLGCLAINLCCEDLVRWLDPSVDIGSERMDLLTKTLVFNTFICMLFFNLFNSRRPDNKTNILKGVSKNKWFMGTSLCIIFPQVLLISFGGRWLQVTRLNVAGWVISLSLGFITIPLGMAIRCLPDEPFTALEDWINTTTVALVTYSSRRGIQAKNGLRSSYCKVVQLVTVAEANGVVLVQKIRHRMVNLRDSLSSLSLDRVIPYSRPSDVGEVRQIHDERTALLTHDIV